MVSMEDVDDTFDDPEDLPLPPPPPAPTSKPTQPTIPPIDRHKKWTTIYPFYLDSKQPHKSGYRRVNTTMALEWPIAENMARACLSLRLEVVFEQDKTHPKDWANPGRIKVLIKREDGTFSNSAIKSKNDLLLALSKLLKPFQPSASLPSSLPSTTTSTPSTPSKSTSKSNKVPTTEKLLPPIQTRYPPNSPAVSFGQFDLAVAGKGPGGPGMFPGAGGAGGEEVQVPLERKPLVKVLPKQKKVHVKRR